MPTSRGDRPRRRRVVAGEQHGVQAERAQLRDRPRRGRLDRVGDQQQAAGGAVPARPARRSGRRSRRPPWPRPARSGSPARRPTDHRVSLDHAVHAQTRIVAEVADRRELRRRRRRSPGRSGARTPPRPPPPARRTSSAVSPLAGTTPTSVIRPVVTVPVLSSTTVSARRVCSSTSGPRITMPSWAPRPVPTMSAVGVASPSAHGQAITRTATAAGKAAAGSTNNQATSVSSAIPITTGTNTADTRSASRCTGALPACACSTSRASWASCVSAPTRVARTTSRPPAFTVPPATASPGPTSTGTDSPVSMLASTADVPSTTSPSVAIFSPGRTTNRSPTARDSTGTRISVAVPEHRDILRAELKQCPQRVARATLRPRLGVPPGEQERGHPRRRLEVDRCRSGRLARAAS